MKKWTEEVTVTMTVDDWLGVVLALKSEALNWVEDAPLAQNLREMAEVIHSRIE